jgi:hypothetical protein
VRAVPNCSGADLGQRDLGSLDHHVLRFATAATPEARDAHRATAT